MSNEFKDWLAELANSPVKSKEWNRWLLYKYPWLTPSNVWSGKYITDCAGENGDTGFWPGEPNAHPEYDYEFTWADSFPDGWWNNFGLQMCEEIEQCLRELPEENYRDFRITDIKEKYGTLHFYTNWVTDKLNKIIYKYENLSEHICIKCGKPATKVSCGWISFYCDDCAPEGSITTPEFYRVDEEDNGG